MADSVSRMSQLASSGEIILGEDTAASWAVSSTCRDSRKLYTSITPGQSSECRTGIVKGDRFDPPGMS